MARLHTSVSRARDRRNREREIVAATRLLFDERGLQDAPIEDIARQVGINKALIYRQFSSKEELYVLTVTDYLEELDEILRQAIGQARSPIRALERCVHAYAGYCQRYPAFLDCSLSLMHRPARDLREIVSDAVWLRLGQGMAACLDQVAAILRSGNEAGTLDVADPDYMANVLWTQMLGVMHLARIRVGVREVAPGVPGLFAVDPDRLVQTCVDGAMAIVGARA